VVAKIRERIAVEKQGSHKFQMERLNLKKLNEVEGKEKYRVEVLNRFAWKIWRLRLKLILSGKQLEEYCHVYRLGSVTNNSTGGRIGYRIYSLWRL
jgi:hypothetical protein